MILPGLKKFKFDRKYILIKFTINYWMVYGNFLLLDGVW